MTGIDDNPVLLSLALKIYIFAFIKTEFLERAFNLLPPHQASAARLIIEIDEDQVSFLFYNDDDSATGLLKFYFDKNSTQQDIADAINKIRAKESDLQQSFKSVGVFYNFAEVTIIPTAYENTGANKKLLQLQFNKTPLSEIGHEEISQQQLSCIYKIPTLVQQAIVQNFPASILCHSTACQARDYSVIDQTRIIFYKTKFKLFIIDNNQLKLAQSFSYSNEADVLYHLLNCFELLEKDPKKAEITISGMIEKDSKVYESIHQYFYSIDFAGTGEQITLSGGLADYPVHFFYHLLQFAKCV